MTYQIIRFSRQIITPSMVPTPAGGGFATITQTGTTVFAAIGTLNNTGSQSITVPAGTTFLAVFMGTFLSSTNNTFSGGSATFTKGAADTAMDFRVAAESNTSIYQSGIFTMANPDIGAGTFKFDLAGVETASVQPRLACMFFSGVNLTDPVRDADGLQVNSSLPQAVPTMTAQSGDNAIGFDFYSIASGEGNITSWTNASVDGNAGAADGSGSDAATGIGAPSGNVAVGPSAGTDGAIDLTTVTRNHAIVAIILKPAAL